MAFIFGCKTLLHQLSIGNPFLDFTLFDFIHFSDVLDCQLPLNDLVYIRQLLIGFNVPEPSFTANFAIYLLFIAKDSRFSVFATACISAFDRLLNPAQTIWDFLELFVCSFLHFLDNFCKKCLKICLKGLVFLGHSVFRLCSTDFFQLMRLPFILKLLHTPFRSILVAWIIWSYFEHVFADFTLTQFPWLLAVLYFRFVDRRFLRIVFDELIYSIFAIFFEHVSYLICKAFRKVHVISIIALHYELIKFFRLLSQQKTKCLQAKLFINLAILSKFFVWIKIITFISLSYKFALYWMKNE